MTLRWILLIALAMGGIAHGAETRDGFHHVYLGESYADAVQRLDLRDIERALAAVPAGGKPDLGSFGYGCMRREDAGAEVSCVTHDVHPPGLELREIRLSFIEGTLQFFSVTAEVRQRDALIARIAARYGAGAVDAADAGALSWRSSTAQVRLHTGPSLVFAAFEQSTYAAAVERRRRALAGHAVR